MNDSIVKETRCACCGSPVIVVVGEEGTMRYEPLKEVLWRVVRVTIIKDKGQDIEWRQFKDAVSEEEALLIAQKWAQQVYSSEGWVVDFQVSCKPAEPRWEPRYLVNVIGKRMATRDEW